MESISITPESVSSLNEAAVTSEIHSLEILHGRSENDITTLAGSKEDSEMCCSPACPVPTKVEMELQQTGSSSDSCHDADAISCNNQMENHSHTFSGVPSCHPNTIKSIDTRKEQLKASSSSSHTTTTSSHNEKDMTLPLNASANVSKASDIQEVIGIDSFSAGVDEAKQQADSANIMHSATDGTVSSINQCRLSHSDDNQLCFSSAGQPVQCQATNASTSDATVVTLNVDRQTEMTLSTCDTSSTLCDESVTQASGGTEPDHLAKSLSVVTADGGNTTDHSGDLDSSRQSHSGAGLADLENLDSNSGCSVAQVKETERNDLPALQVKENERNDLPALQVKENERNDLPALQVKENERNDLPAEQVKENERNDLPAVKENERNDLPAVQVKENERNDLSAVQVKPEPLDPDYDHAIKSSTGKHQNPLPSLTQQLCLSKTASSQDAVTTTIQRGKKRVRVTIIRGEWRTPPQARYRNTTTSNTQSNPVHIDCTENNTGSTSNTESNTRSTRTRRSARQLSRLHDVVKEEPSSSVFPTALYRNAHIKTEPVDGTYPKHQTSISQQQATPATSSLENLQSTASISRVTVPGRERESDRMRSPQINPTEAACSGEAAPVEREMKNCAVKLNHLPPNILTSGMVNLKADPQILRDAIAQSVNSLRSRSASRPWACEQCGKSYKTKSARTQHLKVHLGVRDYVCTTCGADFMYKSVLTAHHRFVHAGERPYHCSECGKGFGWRTHLQVHLKRHFETKSCVCPICHKDFSSCYINKHIETHSDHRPFSCILCGAKFKLKRSVEIHQNALHSGYKPFKCDQCGQVFPYSSSLYVHKRVHANERPYSCSRCPSTFTQSTHLRTHLKGVHKVLNPPSSQTRRVLVKRVFAQTTPLGTPGENGPLHSRAKKVKVKSVGRKTAETTKSTKCSTENKSGKSKQPTFSLRKRNSQSLIGTTAGGQQGRKASGCKNLFGQKKAAAPGKKTVCGKTGFTTTRNNNNVVRLKFIKPLS